jgi:hypothetical protein
MQESHQGEQEAHSLPVCAGIFQAHLPQAAITRGTLGGFLNDTKLLSACYQRYRNPASLEP